MGGVLFRNIGLIFLSAGFPCLVMGLLMEMQVGDLLKELSRWYDLSESTQRTALWVRGTYWPAPYLVWIGGAFVSLSIVLGTISGLLVSENDNVDMQAYSDRMAEKNLVAWTCCGLVKHRGAGKRAHHLVGTFADRDDNVVGGGDDDRASSL